MRRALVTATIAVLAVATSSPAARPAEYLPLSFAGLVDRVAPAVVNISTTAVVDAPAPLPGVDDGSGETNPFQLPERKVRRRSLGSGIIIDPEGYIVTNNHVIEQAQEIRIKIGDGREVKGVVVGRDPKTDLALLKISPPVTHLPVLPLGNSDTVRPGDWIIAVGNAFGLEHTVTKGIISATARVIGAGTYDEFLQTDAAINPGNSGGPLVNLSGEVIGISSAVLATGQGIGFAIPSNLAKSIVPQLKAHGKVRRGWVGASIQTVTPLIVREFRLEKAEGALVSDVQEGGPAERGGLRQGDVIVSFDGRKITKAIELPRFAGETPVGKKVRIGIVRDGVPATVSVEVADIPEKKDPPPLLESVTSFGIIVRDGGESALEGGKRGGLLISSVLPGSPAADAGFLPGDLLLQMNRKGMSSLEGFTSAVNGLPSGEPVLFLVRRGGKGLYLTMGPSF